MILALDTTSNRAKFKLKTYSLLPYKVNVFYNCRKIRFLVRRLPFVLVERKKIRQNYRIDDGKCNYKITNQIPDATNWAKECLTDDFKYYFVSLFNFSSVSLK